MRENDLNDTFVPKLITKRKVMSIQDYHKKLTAPGRRGALKECGLLAGCATRNDPTRFFLHGAKSKYGEALLKAADQVIARYEEEEKYRKARSKTERKNKAADQYSSKRVGKQV